MWRLNPDDAVGLSIRGVSPAASVSEPSCDPDDRDLDGGAFITSIFRVQRLGHNLGRLGVGDMLDPLGPWPTLSQITKMPGGTGTRWLTSIRMRSPLESSGSIEAPSTVHSTLRIPPPRECRFLEWRDSLGGVPDVESQVDDKRLYGLVVEKGTA